MAMTLAALKTELQTDPSALGYGPFVANGATGTLADMLNLPRAGISINRSVLKTWEIIAATVISELTALSATEKDLYRIVASSGEVDVSDPQIRVILAALFPAGSVTRANVLARISRQGSRAEQLFGSAVSHSQVSQALRS